MRGANAYSGRFASNGAWEFTRALSQNRTWTSFWGINLRAMYLLYSHWFASFLVGYDLKSKYSDWREFRILLTLWETDPSLSEIGSPIYFSRRRSIKSAGPKRTNTFFHFSISRLTDRLARCSVPASTFENSETTKLTLPLKQAKRIIVTSQYYLAKGVEPARENEEKKHWRGGGNLLEVFLRGSTSKKQQPYHEMKNERAASSERKRREINPFTQGKWGVRMEICIAILSHLVKNTRDSLITIGRKARGG